MNRATFSVLLSVLVALVLVNFVAADYEHDLEYPESQAVVEHHRSKRSPYDPIIPALLLGKSAFLLGTLLGPKLLQRPVYHHRPHYRRVYHHGGGGYGGGGGYSGGSGYSGGYSSGGWHGWR